MKNSLAVVLPFREKKKKILVQLVLCRSIVAVASLLFTKYQVVLLLVPLYTTPLCWMSFYFLGTIFNAAFYHVQFVVIDRMTSTVHENFKSDYGHLPHAERSRNTVRTGCNDPPPLCADVFLSSRFQHNI